jgi:hypothetical protein
VTLRTVGVRLQADVRDYINNLRGAGRSTDALNDKIGATGAVSAKAGAKVEGLGDSLAGTSRKAKDASAETSEYRRNLEQLDRQIAETTAEIVLLAKAFARTGDTKFVDKINEQKKSLRGLSDIRKLMPEPDAQAMTGWARGLMGSMSTALSSAAASAPPLAIAGGIIGAAIAPSIAAGMGSALAAGVGLSGLLAGIAVMAKDPRIAGYGKSIGESFMKSLKKEAEVFRAPLMQSMDLLAGASVRVSSKLGDLFDNVAPSLTGFTEQLIRMGEALLDNLVGASENAEPALKAMGDLIGGVGGAFGDMIETLSANSEEGASALKDLTGALVSFIETTTAMMDALAQVKGGFDDFDSWIDEQRYKLEDNVSWLDATADGYEKGSAAAELYRQGKIGSKGSFDDYEAWLAREKKATDDAAIAHDNAGNAIRGQRKALEGLAKEMQAQADPIFGMLTAQETLKESQTKLNDAIKKHGRNSAEARKATQDLALAAIDLQGKAGAVAGTFSGSLTPEMMATFRAAGLTEGQINAVADQFRNAHSAADKYQGDYAAAATAPGVDGAKKKFENAWTAANKFHGPYVAEVSVTGYDGALGKLNRLSVYQQALKSGKIPPGFHGPIKGPDGKWYAEGGWTGPGSKYQPAGIVHADEFVIQKSARQKFERDHPGVLTAINQTGELPHGYAGGGQVWPYRTTASKTRIPSMAAVEDAVQVVDAGGAGGSFSGTGNGGAGGSGWQFLVAVSKRAFPSLGVWSTFRRNSRTLSGNVSYHARGRAVDFAPNRAHAEWVNANYFGRTKELITPWNNLNIHNGRRHTYTGAVWRQHNFPGGNAHNHWAMYKGGVIPEPVFGVGASGRTYSFGELGPERVSPMGGYASGGLVTGPPSAGTPKLDDYESLIQVRDAIDRLSESLKENGRTFSSSTAKGRANMTAIMAVTKAARDAATAKFEETGSVKQANGVYDVHIKALDTLLAKQKIASKDRKNLIKVFSERPTFTPAADSSTRVKNMQDLMAFEETLASSKQAFAWTKPLFNERSEAGRAELSQLFSFLGAAEQSAQSYFNWTGNKANAIKQYNSQVGQLRAILKKSGLTDKEISVLFEKYARITLQPRENRWGGLYEHAAGGALREAQIAGAGPTRYAWAEPATGGELFAPKNGNLAKTRAQVQWAVQNWWGGRVNWGGSKSGGVITVNATIPITLGTETITRQVRFEVDTAVGRVVDAAVYQTA